MVAFPGRVSNTEEAFKKLKLPNGDWRRFDASTPSGSRTSVFVGLDKSPQMVRREVETKKPMELVREESYPGQWRAHRAQGVIYKGSSPVIRVLVPDRSSEPTVLQWNYRMVAELGVDKGKLTEAFEARFGSAARVQWSI